MKTLNKALKIILKTIFRNPNLHNTLRSSRPHTLQNPRKH